MSGMITRYWDPCTNTYQEADLWAQYDYAWYDGDPYVGKAPQWDQSILPSRNARSHHQSQQPYQLSARPRQPRYPQKPPPTLQSIVTIRDSRRGTAVAHIPAEIWHYIFDFCMGSYRGEDRTRFRPSPKAMPMKLSQICRGLRYLAHKKPDLWSTICLSPTPNSRAATFPGRRLIRHYVSLALNRPLDVIFDPCLDDRGSLANAKVAIPNIFNVMLEYLPQWGSVTLWGPWTRFAPMFPQHPGPQQLQSITLEGSVEHDAITPFVSYLVSCAPLRSFVWREVNEGQTPERHHTPGLLSKLPFRGGAMTRIDLMTPLTVVEVAQLAAAMPNLKELTINNLLPEEGQYGADLPFQISLNQLEYLKLMVDLDYFSARKPGSILCTMLAALCTPNLKTLYLGYDEGWSQRRFERFLNASRPRLRSLVFDIMCIKDTDLLHTLKEFMGELEELTLNTPEDFKSPLTAPLLEQMTHRGAWPMVTPKLRRITVNGPTLFPSEGRFAHMVNTRLMKNFPIQRVDVSVAYSRNPLKNRKLPDLANLLNLRRRGLHVNINEERW